jgi:hypothetical protein
MPSKETLLSLADPAESGVWGEYDERDGRRITQLFEGWKNNDLVTFVLRYESPPAQTSRHRVNVMGVLTRASTVEKLRGQRK